MLNDNTKAMVWALYENDNCSKSEIARKLSISRNAVYAILSNKKYKKAQVSENVKKIYEDKAKQLIESLLEDDRPTQIVDKILDKLNDDEVIQNELDKFGIRTLVGAMKIVVENTVKIKELNKPQNSVIVHNNIGDIMKLIEQPTDVNIDPKEEIEEFKAEMVQ